jgi:peptidoglycan/LPS O-acetylase OafA/YrhL
MFCFCSRRKVILPSVLNPFLHTWSLAVEEQFYLVWPALLLLISRRVLRPARLAVTLAGVTLLSFALCVWLTRYNQPWAFYASPARAWEFGIGGLAALGWVTSWARRWKLLPMLGWVAAGALLLSFVLITEASSFPGYIALLPVAATACVLVCGAAQNERGPAGILRAAPFQWIGRRSYSIYLWHWPILALAVAIYPSMSPALSPARSVAGGLICAALTLICAALSYQWLEAPIRNSPWLARRSIRSIGLGVGLTAMGVAAAICGAFVAKHFASSPGQRVIASAARARSVASQRGCLVQAKVSDPVSCVFGDPSSSVTIVLFGDSHAGQWSSPLASVSKAEHWRMVTYLKSGCAAANVPVFDPRLHRISDECVAWRANAIGAIVRLRPNLIVVSEFSSRYTRGGPSTTGVNSARFARWAARMKRTVNDLRGAGSQIVLLRDSPTPKGDMENCLEDAQWRGVSKEICDRPRASAVDSGLTRAESQLADSIPGVRFVDLTSEFCSETTCPAWRNGMMVYRDSSHMTNGYAASLAEPLRAALLDLLHPSQNRP